MKTIAGLAIALIGLAAPPGFASSAVTFYEDSAYRGRSMSTQQALPSLQRTGFNDQVSSLKVRGDAWEFCEEPRFRGICVVLRPGAYRSMRAMGLNNRLSSARPVRRAPARKR